MKLNLNKIAVRTALCLTVVAGITIAGAGTALAVTPTSGGPLRAGASDPEVCTSSYDHSAQSVDVSMYNGTDEPLTVDPALTGHNGTGEHWAQQPPTIIEPGQCADMNAYSPDALSGLAAYAVYTLPNGSFVPFMGDIFGASDNNPYDSQVFSSAPQLDDSSYNWSGTQDPSYNIQGNWVNGDLHRHIVLKLEGGETGSMPMTSPQTPIAAGGSTGNLQASCPLGYHVRMNATTNQPIVSFANVSGSTSGFGVKSVSPNNADGSADGSTQYQGFGYSLQNTGSAAGTGTMSWTCDPSIYAAQAPAFQQDTPPESVATYTPVAYRFFAQGFPAATYGVKSGVLPTGLKLDLNGDLTGTPTTPGTYTFTVVASNAAGGATTEQISMVVS
jgi:hypothetical protein